MVQSWYKIRFGVNSIGIFKTLLEKTNIGEGEIQKRMVRIKRLELSCLAAPDPKSGVSTNFTISAHNSSKFCEAKASS